MCSKKPNFKVMNAIGGSTYVLEWEMVSIIRIRNEFTEYTVILCKKLIRNVR